MPELTPTPHTTSELALEDQVLAGLHVVRPLIAGPLPAPVDELQRTAMASGAIEWQPRSRADRTL